MQPIEESGIIGAFRDVTSDQSAKILQGKKILKGKLNFEEQHGDILCKQMIFIQAVVPTEAVSVY